MKRYRTIAIVMMVVLIYGCNQKSRETTEVEMVDNNYPTAMDAFAYAKENLHQILSESQLRSYNLGSKEQIMQMVTTHELPVMYLPMEGLKDTVLRPVAGGMIYALGNGENPNICVTVKNPSEKYWIISTVGQKKYLNAFARFQGIAAVIEVPGLAIALLELKTETGPAYVPIADYPQAELFEEKTYTAPEVLRLLGSYRDMLEKRYGKEFLGGALDM